MNIGDLFTENNHLVSYEYLSTKGIDFSTYMTWRGIIRAIKSKYREPKHLANENFSLNRLDVTINHEKMSLSSLCRNKRIYQEFEENQK